MTDSALEVVLGPLASIPPGEGRAFAVGEKRVAIFRTRSEHIFAVQAECPHKGGPLADGLIGGTTLICPLHAWKFDLSSGEALMGSCGLSTFPVRVDDASRIVLTLDR